MDLVEPHQNRNQIREKFFPFIIELTVTLPQCTALPPHVEEAPAGPVVPTEPGVQHRAVLHHHREGIEGGPAQGREPGVGDSCAGGVRKGEPGQGYGTEK